MKSTLTALLACLLISTGAAFALTCKDDNKVNLSDGKRCCCKHNTATASPNDYICYVRDSKCPSGEIGAGMRDRSGNAFCFCMLTLAQ